MAFLFGTANSSGSGAPNGLLTSETSEVNRGYINRQGQLIVGTITDGITIFDEDGNRIANYNTQKGLQTNAVLGISTDEFDNIWLALDSGIDFISHEGNNGVADRNNSRHWRSL